MAQWRCRLVCSGRERLAGRSERRSETRPTVASTNLPATRARNTTTEQTTSCRHSMYNYPNETADVIECIIDLSIDLFNFLSIDVVNNHLYMQPSGALSTSSVASLTIKLSHSVYHLSRDSSQGHPREKFSPTDIRIIRRHHGQYYFTKMMAVHNHGCPSPS